MLRRERHGRRPGRPVACGGRRAVRQKSADRRGQAELCSVRGLLREGESWVSFWGCERLGIEPCSTTSSVFRLTYIHLSFFFIRQFSFSNGCGLPGRIFKSGVPTWEQFVSKAPADLFERRGGAVQFGIKTALGVPVVSPNVGRVVLILYSKHDRSKDEALVGRMISDLRLMNPCARWRLVVDIDPDASPSSGGVGTAPTTRPSSLCLPPAVGGAGTAGASPVQSVGAALAPFAAPAAPTVPPPPSGTDSRVKDLILLLGESIPSDLSTPLGKQLQGLMSLRLVLLKRQRTPEEDQLVETVLVLFESYKSASRPREDIAILLARDFSFHLQHCQTLSLVYGQRQPLAQRPLLMAPQQQQQPLYAHRAGGLAGFGSLGNLGMTAGQFSSALFANQRSHSSGDVSTH